ncbi:hypothetical protein PF008_g7765 [Phytophthora fragariae]|uniref:Acyltransferase n=1 Tax=Phytophthora fragariae TaxID=53985 RepID=A0A6G0S379_9STRA|nr:hypothetical protein PF008_g7765 [Phytophthora fragariae]
MFTARIVGPREPRCNTTTFPVNDFRWQHSMHELAQVKKSSVASRRQMPSPRQRHRKPKTLPPPIPRNDDVDPTTISVDRLNARSAFLLAMAVTSFAAFTLFTIAELTHHHPRFLFADVLQGDTHLTAQWALLLAVPATSAAAWFPISISHAPRGVLRITSSMPTPSSSLLMKLARRYRRNHMFAIYQSVGWTLYALFVALQLICFGSDSVHDLPFSRPGSRSVQAVAAFIAEVLIISSVLTLEKRRDRNRQRRKDRFVVQLNNFNNMLLLVGATLLALASEYTRMFPHPSGSSVGYPMATGLGSLALFVTALFNTYGLGGLINNFLIPNVMIFLLFAVTTNLSRYDVALYSFLAWAVEAAMMTSRSISTILYLKDSHNGLRKEINRWHVKYALPHIVTGCIPAVATYRHYIYDMEAFVPVLIVSIVVYCYELTFFGNPQETGCRERASWVNGHSFLIETTKRYFNGNIIRMAPLDPKKQYILGFHPHGITPISVMWLQFNAQWRTLFPNFYAHILTAGIMHKLPLSRDLLQFLGSREVSRQAFTYTLQEKESVLVVPGGQAEMLEQQSGKNEVRVYTHHKGFIRLAIQHGVPLVPVLSFNEGEMLDTIRAPMLQRWSVKKFAIPFPFFPYGRGLLPIPRKVHMPIVIGEPLQVPHIAKPTQKDIDKVHSKYFAVLEQMFERYKDEVGCGSYKLVFV